MEKLLIVLCAALGLATILVALPEGAVSVLVTAVMTIAAVFLIRYYAEDEEKTFLIEVFLAAMLVRLGLGLAIHVFDLRGLFGPDATLYNEAGQRLLDVWRGIPVPNDEVTFRATEAGSSGWGMFYLVAFLYFIHGQSILAAQSFCAVVGAATAPMIYFCAKNIFNNSRVARISALFIAFFPSFIIWSSQLLKDGLIIFLLVCVITMVLQLQKKFSYLPIAVLILSLAGIITLRFYIFYMVAAAVAGSFIVGLSNSVQSTLRNVVVIMIVGISLTYLGVIRNASTELETYGSLKRVQISRQDLAKSADSGFGEDVDVSTAEGAISAIPIGLAYLMMAPFPWQVTKLNQVMILPEIFVWWALLPVMLFGLWYTIKNRLRSAIPILIFTIMLTIAYSIFQGNVGMAYRQRTQIQVFLFIFIAVGWTIFLERRENRKTLRQANQQRLAHVLRAKQN